MKTFFLNYISIQKMVTILAIFVCILTVQIKFAQAQETDKDEHILVVAVFEHYDDKHKQNFKDYMDELNLQSSNPVELVLITLDQNNDHPSFETVCGHLLSGINLIIDFTWEGWVHIQSLASGFDIPYVRADITISHYVNAMEKYLRFLEATNAVAILPDAGQMEQALGFLVGNTIVRFLIVDGSVDKSMAAVAGRKPTPKYHVFIGTSAELRILINKAKNYNMLTDASRVVLVIKDFLPFELEGISGEISKLVPAMCCTNVGWDKENCDCIKAFVKQLASTFSKYFTNNRGQPKVIADCQNYSAKMEDPTTSYNADFYELFQHQRNNLHLTGLCLQWPAEITPSIKVNSSFYQVGSWSYTYGTFSPANANMVNLGKLRHFRIGVAWEVPFLYNKTDENGVHVLDAKGQSILEGYCIELIDKLAQEMMFQYTLVAVEKTALEVRYPNGTWGGLLRTLIDGEIDMILAPLVITAEKEEAVDFVAPYFEQTGISIVMNRAKKATSVFKFMSVLKDEVWLCILGALVITAIVLFIVDKSSPYSGKNKTLYPYKCRDFTFGECFWFVLTSVTPQGGGEPPKAVSGRVLVAGYWIFIVLMLATFTANLAAFLTVERMQTPVSSLDELSVQSKVHYSVVDKSSTHQFFINMANAEDELAKIWKDMTLNATGAEQDKYRVWDYPIREQFGRILGVIDMREKMKTEDEGFAKVKNIKDFAFIHDALRVRHIVYNNCNLTEVGEPFAEQPYAVAVQSGSHLQEEIAKHFLVFQKNRIFEMLSEKYWNNTECKRLTENENADGITLDSIGGVFIITLAGLGIGMLTLVGEIIMYRCDKKSKVVAIKVRPKKSMAGH